jgi:antitoxin ParD1/3/4
MATMTMNISLPATMKEYVEEQVNGGGYNTASEYFRELVREDQKRKAQERLEALLLERLESGKSAPLTKEDLDGVRRTLREKIAARGGKAQA